MDLEDGIIAYSTGLGFKATDSHEIYKKNRPLSLAQQSSHGGELQARVFCTKTGSDYTVPTKFTPTKSTDPPIDPNSSSIIPATTILGSTSSGAEISSNPKYVPPNARLSTLGSSISSLDLVPSLEATSTTPNPNPQDSTFSGHSPKRACNLSPARKLQQVFQQETERVEFEDRLSGMIDNFTENLGKIGNSAVDGDILAKMMNIQQTWNALQSRVQQSDPQPSESNPGTSNPPNPSLRLNNLGISYVAGDPNMGYSGDMLKPRVTMPEVTYSNTNLPSITIIKEPNPTSQPVLKETFPPTKPKPKPPIDTKPTSKH